MHVRVNRTAIVQLIFIEGLRPSQNHVYNNVIVLPASAFTFRSILNPISILHPPLTLSRSHRNSHSVTNSMIRPPSIHDLPDMKRIIDAAELFPSEMMDDMTKSYFDHQGQQTTMDGNTVQHDSSAAITALNNGSTEHWFVKVVTEAPKDSQQPPTDVVVALVYAGPEKMTEGCYNVFLLAVHPNYQRQGYGRALMTHVADQLTITAAARVLLVETSGNDEFATAREFYSALGYTAVARIPEFYQKGEDKIIYHKFLQ